MNILFREHPLSLSTVVRNMESRPDAVRHIAGRDDLRWLFSRAQSGKVRDVSLPILGRANPGRLQLRGGRLRRSPENTLYESMRLGKP